METESDEEEKEEDKEESDEEKDSDAEREEAIKDAGDHFEGVAKKNTRKKKTKQQNIYSEGMDDMAGVFDEGADSDEVHMKKQNKTQKRNE